MKVNREKFIVSDIHMMIDKGISRFEQIVLNTKSEQCVGILEKLKLDLSTNASSGILSVAMIGQYNAGKSTIVTALTNRGDIEIDSDIKTSSTAEYLWNGIHIIDTPGLWTDRKDHDETTYEAIRKSDLLVFCMTNQLFDNITLPHFTSLAWEKGYHRKILLVINKMSAEAGTREELINSYEQSLNEALVPHSVDEFSHVYIDAKDYIYGLEDTDADLIQESYFDSFIEVLNEHVAKNGILARLETPIRIFIGSIDDTIDAIARDEDYDDSNLLMLKQIDRRVRNERQRLQTNSKQIALELVSKISAIGRDLAAQLGQNKNFDSLCKEKELELEKLCSQYTEKLEPLCIESANAIEKEISEVLNSELAKQFAANISAEVKLNVDDPKSTEEFKRRKQQWSKLESIGKQAGAKVADFAQGPNAGGAGLLRAGNAAGGQLHKVVYGVGKAIGVKFKPWQAVNIAKGMGNVARVAGPILAVLSIALDVVDDVKSEKYSNDLSKARRELIGQFLDIGNEFEKQIELFIRTEANPIIFDGIQKSLDDARRDHINAIADSTEHGKLLLEIRTNMEELKSEIARS